MGRSSPRAMAMVKKVLFISSRQGRPKEILDTPSTVLSPSSDFTRARASSVLTACSCWADTVRVRQSIKTSSLGIPADSAAFSMRRAMSTRPSTVSGMPFSSRHRPSTAAPYFLAMGSTWSSTSALPFTELTMALPQYCRRPLSRAAGSEESICRGRSRAPCRPSTTCAMTAGSSIWGWPTFTSRMSAPASA